MKVLRLTEIVYKRYKNLLEIYNKRIHMINELDHMYSIKSGFENNIPIHICDDMITLHIHHSRSYNMPHTKYIKLVNINKAIYEKKWYINE